MQYAFDLWDPPSLAIVGQSTRFPVRHVFCVGRNYAEHAKEMGGDASKEPPFFFSKPAHSVVSGGGTIQYPLATKNLHYEFEMVVAIGKEGTHIPREAALDHVFGYALGLDMTRRDLQDVAKQTRRPWDFGKAFDEAAPIGPIYPVATHGHHSSGKIWLNVNGELKQRGDLRDMIWPVPDMIAFLTDYYTLRPGDLIMTGTPAGVGAVVPGDELVGGVDGLGELAVKIAPPLHHAK
jgi:fumarylpyruvate hydrolase